MKARVRRIFSHLEDGVDLIVFANSTDPHLDLSFLYATGLTDGLFEGCAAFCHPDGGVDIVTSVLEVETAKKSGLPLHPFRTRDEREQAFRKLLRGHRKIGINFAEITRKAAEELRSFAPKAKFFDATQAVVRARLVKDETELARLRKAGRIASRAFEDILPIIRAGRRESEIAADLVYAMQRRGSSGPSFRTIVGSGPNSAEPHYTAGPRKIQKGDFIVIDFGARYEHYCSDVTRTVVVGKASEKQRAIYETVRRAQAQSMKKMRPGVRAKAVDTVARTIIDGTEFKGRFIHGLGHSIGLAVHDGGSMNQSSDIVLRKDMVFTNEPGIYVPGFGGVRIEDDVHITASGPKLLSMAPRQLLEL
ncbi:MAG: aminopeptidase P family protein [Euryarchaeota archaeon]|nr:aminopeptidase P family protein [Euryarchaeota archaeon]